MNKREYQIPEGMKARIEGNKVILESKESEDERIRKEIIKHFEDRKRRLIQMKEYTKSVNYPFDELQLCQKALAWLEKLGEKEYALKSFKDVDVHKFVQYIERQSKAYELNLPNRSYDIYGFAKDILSWFEKQDSQNLANSAKSCKDEPKFKVGDWVVFNNKHQSIYQVEKIEDGYYILRHTHGGTFRVCVLHDESLRLWTIQDAEDGDVLAEHETIVLFKEIDGLNIRCYCTYHYLGYNPDLRVDTLQNKKPYYPATEEERDLLFRKMKEAGYEWDAEKKEMRKIEQKSAWSGEDEKMLKEALRMIEKPGSMFKGEILTKKVAEWLKSLKERYTWKPSDEQMYYLSWIANIKLGDSIVEQEVSKHLNELYDDLKKLREGYDRV